MHQEIARLSKKQAKCEADRHGGEGGSEGGVVVAAGLLIAIVLTKVNNLISLFLNERLVSGKQGTPLGSTPLLINSKKQHYTDYLHYTSHFQPHFPYLLPSAPYLSFLPCQKLLISTFPAVGLD